MNLRAVGWLLGCVLLLLSAFLLVPAVVGLLYREPGPAMACLESSLVAFVIGGVMFLVLRGSTLTTEGRSDYFRREGMAVVGLSWLTVAAVGALPFLFAGVMRSPIDAFFETASGFTTTGATVLSGPAIDRLSNTLAFWRCFTHWLGGIGIVMVFVLFAPPGGRSLFRSEVPGISREANLQRVRDSALALVRVYLVLTTIHAVLLWLAGMTPFDAVIHSFSSMGTGGFSNHGNSIAYYDSFAIELICIVFMIAAGLNFGLYDAVVRFGPRRALRMARSSSEVRFYLGMILVAFGTISVGLWFWGGSNGSPQSDLPDYSSLVRSMRDAAFSVVSMQTSTGYVTADFDRWPDVCRLILLLCLFVGACAGSTGGGLKVIRFLIVAKVALTGLRRFGRPRAIYAISVDGQTLSRDLVSATTSYVVLWLLAMLVGALFLTLFRVDLVTAISATISCLNNIGPGLAGVGPSQHFGDMPQAVKLLLALWMILGRLEFYAIVTLLLPGFWRR